MTQKLSNEKKKYTMAQVWSKGPYTYFKKHQTERKQKIITPKIITKVHLLLWDTSEEQLIKISHVHNLVTMVSFP